MSELKISYWQHYFIWFLVGSIVFLHILVLNDAPELGSDQNSYLLLARSLSSGAEYTNSWLFGDTPHIKFPFLFPAILVPFVRYIGFNMLVLKIVVVIAGLMSIWAVMAFFKKVKPSFAVAVTVLTLVSPQIFKFSHSIMAEMPYLFFSMLALNFATRYLSSQEWLNRNAFLTALFVCLAYFTRSVGIALCLALPLFLLFENQNQSKALKKAAFVAILCIIPVGIWSLRSQIYATTGDLSYFQSLFTDPYTCSKPRLGMGDFVIRVAESIYAYAFYAVPELVTGICFHSRSFFAFSLSALVFFGFLYCFLRERKITEWYTLIYMGLLFFWPWSKISGTRFAIPLTPLLFYYFLRGLYTFLGYVIPEKYKLPALKWLTIGLIFLNSMGIIWHAWHAYRYNWHKSPEAGFVSMAEFVRYNTDPQSRFFCLLAPAFYRFSDRKSVFIERGTDSEEETIRAICQKQIDFIVIDSTYSPYGLKYLLPKLPSILAKYPDKFLRIYNANGNSVYKVRYCNPSSLERSSGLKEAPTPGK